MASQASLDLCYMQCAEAHGDLSYAKRFSNGAVIVTKHGVVVGGVNGLPKQLGNVCEYPSDEHNDGTGLATKMSVIHGEVNCIIRAAKEGVSVDGGTLYTEMICCEVCASIILAAGIRRVVYKYDYRDPTGFNVLSKHLEVVKL